MFLSIHRHPNGFVISMILKRTNAIVDNVMNIYGVPEKKSTDITEIHVPKNSS